MTEDWIVVICGVIVIVVAVAIAVWKFREAERRSHESTHKLKVYTELLNAITELNLSGGDPYKMDVAKKNLAVTLNLAMVRSPGFGSTTTNYSPH